MEKKNKFKIIIPSYNNEEWVEPNMASIINQTYTNYEVLYINDCSTDKTQDKVTEIINEYDLNKKWTLVSNSENRRRGYNISPHNTNIKQFIDNDEDILVFVDGDDWLINDKVLENLNNFYNKNKSWMTYGGMYCYPSNNFGNPQNTPYNSDVHKNNLYRKDYWRASHLRTFKWHLYKLIKEKDIIFSKTNKHYFHAEDLATSFPCLEMCPEQKIGVLNFPTYAFNETISNRKRGIEREQEAGLEIEQEIRNQKPYQQLELPLSSIDLFKWNRFDLPIKLLFLKDSVRNCSFGEEIYKQHLKLWNGFKEYNNPDKNTYEKFKETFLNILTDIKSNKFDWNKSPITINSENYLLNGSHRTAASAFLNKKANFELGQDIKDGQKVCDYKMFNELKLDKKYMDAAALEMVRNNKKLLMVSLFPSATHSRNIDDILLKYGNIAYKKDVALNSNGAFNYTLQLYKGEEWAGSWYNNFAGYRDKARLCFTNTNHPLSIYLVEFDDLTQARSAKEEIRAIYNIGNHSVHINDTHEETLRLARCILNDNSIHFLNNSYIKQYNNFLNQLEYYEDYIIKHNLDNEDFCITASSVLSLYGLREGNDLDYLHADNIILGHNDIHSHNEYSHGRYSETISEILYNPDNHFYFGNLKVAKLNIIKDLKEKRQEPKDKIDIELINTVL